MPRKSRKPSDREDHPLADFDNFEMRNTGRAFGYHDAYLGNLKNDIHPYFRFIIDVPGIQLVLRSTSLGLTHDSVLLYWFAMLIRSLERLDEESQKFGGDCFRLLSCTLPLTNNEKGLIRERLLTAADHLKSMRFMPITKVNSVDAHFIAIGSPVFPTGVW